MAIADSNIFKAQNRARQHFIGFQLERCDHGAWSLEQDGAIDRLRTTGQKTGDKFCAAQSTKHTTNKIIHIHSTT